MIKQIEKTNEKKWKKGREVFYLFVLIYTAIEEPISHISNFSTFSTILEANWYVFEN